MNTSAHRRSKVAWLLVIALLGAGSATVATSSPASAEYQYLVSSWGTPGSGDGQFQYADDVALDSSGNVYVTDRGTDRVQKFTANGTFVTAWGGPGAGNGQFQDPVGIAVDGANNVYVLDGTSHRVQKFTASGTFLTAWGSDGEGAGQFSTAGGIAADATGNVFVVDYRNCLEPPLGNCSFMSRVQRFNSSGVLITSWGTRGWGPGQLYFPVDITVDANGFVYVADWERESIEKFTSTGSFVASWGDADDGTFDRPHDVAVDPAGTAYVTDGQGRVQRFTSAGTLTSTWAGVAGTRGMAADGNGNLYVADSGHLQRFRFDFVDPTASLSSPPAVDGVYGLGEAVTVDYHCADERAGSGVESCVGTVADGAPLDTSTFGNFEFTVTATDRAGNNSSTTHGYSVVDATDPTVALLIPADGAVIPRHRSVPAEYSCADERDGSGLDTCVGTVTTASPIDTSSLGDHQFTVVATDLAENTAQVMHTYTVANARPDGRIRRGSGIEIGDDDFGNSGAGQIASGSARPGRSVTYTVSAQNDAPFRDTLRVRGQGSTSRFTVRYRSASGTDITGRVTAGTYRTPALDPAETLAIRVVVTVTATAPPHSTLTRTVVVRSTAHPTIGDTVGFLTRRA